MVWQRAGTVAVQNGSTTVIGTNVDFAASSRNGDSFVGPDGATYELANVASSTVISILPAYKGPTVSGAAYAIMPVQGYDKMLSDAFNNLNNQFGPKLAALGTTGNYDVLPPSKGGTGRTSIGTAAAANILGSVAWDNSLNIPSGDILERIDNANGTALRFADGTQINYFETTMAVNVNTQNQNCFYGLAPYWTFPLAFLGGVPAVRADAYLAGYLCWTARFVTAAHAAQVAVMTPGYVASGNFSMSFTAVGKWR
ncbi:hypothetical protein [Pseudomonas costantinii]|uniref:hypothetical protein n=1 Tax=Pseudomonas costantinii TaxID=168469 RepID=UPI0015A3B102|nr:hypothetical protein [Pseudomonas costantinii]NVZ70464.1 hypothetical protein [Pseudomonas costantinii]